MSDNRVKRERSVLRANKVAANTNSKVAKRNKGVKK